MHEAPVHGDAGDVRLGTAPQDLLADLLQTVALPVGKGGEAKVLLEALIELEAGHARLPFDVVQVHFFLGGVEDELPRLEQILRRPAFPGAVEFLRVVVGLGEEEAANEGAFQFRGQKAVAVQALTGLHLAEKMADDAPPGGGFAVGGIDAGRELQRSGEGALQELFEHLGKSVAGNRHQHLPAVAGNLQLLPDVRGQHGADLGGGKDGLSLHRQFLFASDRQADAEAVQRRLFVHQDGHVGAVLLGESFEPRFFSTWGPKVLAAIGKLPPTVMDRSVVIPMKRKAPGEQVERFRHNKLKDLTPLCRQAARWAADNLATLQEADPVVPEQLNDRAADNWRPLLAIADLVGGDWPHRARTAALMLSGGERDPEADGAGVMLIADCVAIFNDRGIDRLSTTDLIEELVKIEERPWPERSKGKHITPRVLARLLKPFGIKPKVERAGNAQFRGYEAHAFDDAHSRYSQGSNVYHPYQSNENNNLYPNFKVYQTPDGTHTKSDLSIEKQMDGTHGTHKNPENGRNERDEQDFDVTTPGFETHCAADLGDLFDSEEVLL